MLAGRQTQHGVVVFLYFVCVRRRRRRRVLYVSIQFAAVAPAGAVCIAFCVCVRMFEGFPAPFSHTYHVRGTVSQCRTVALTHTAGTHFHWDNQINGVVYLKDLYLAGKFMSSSGACRARRRRGRR